MLAFPGLVISIVLLVITIFFGQKINEAGRWIVIFGVSFQPAELAKIAIILYLSMALESYDIASFKNFAMKIIAPIGAVCTLILVGSASTAFIVGTLCFILLIIYGIKWNYLFKTLGIASGVILFVIILHLLFNIFPRLDTALSRVDNFFKSEVVEKGLSAEERQRIADKTYQADMARIAISSVGVLGKGPGKSTQRYVLPHPYSDFIYTIIIEEYGSFVGIFVMMLYLSFLFRCIVLTKRCNKVFAAMLVIGLALLITIQALLHILVNVGIVPVTGHTLPLVSLGGTSFVIMSGAFGIILSVSRTLDSKKNNNLTIAEDEKS